jgi:hypothetical protein
MNTYDHLFMFVTGNRFMGINLIPWIPSLKEQGGPFIESGEYTKELSEHDFEHGCLESEGFHRLLRFDFYCINIGNEPFVAGDPRTQPEIFFLDPTHTHYHAKDFNKYHLLTASGEKIYTKKQAFCVIDYVRYLPTASLERTFRDCDTYQGISPGWADVYRSDIECQYIVLEEPGTDRAIEDGIYTLVAETNGKHEDGPMKGKHIFEVEDTYEDNTFIMRLEIRGDDVLVLDTNRSSNIPIPEVQV